MGGKIEINTQLFKLEDVYLGYSHSVISNRLRSLREVADELDEQVNLVLEKLSGEELTEEMILESSDFITQIETQMVFVEKNIETFRTALSMHENDVAEFFPLLDGFHLCLN